VSEHDGEDNGFAYTINLAASKTKQEPTLLFCSSLKTTLETSFFLFSTRCSVASDVSF